MGFFKSLTNFFNSPKANYIIGTKYKSKEIKAVFIIQDRAGYQLLFTDGSVMDVSPKLMQEIMQGKHIKPNSILIRKKLGIK